MAPCRPPAVPTTLLRRLLLMIKASRTVSCGNRAATVPHGVEANFRTANCGSLSGFVHGTTALLLYRRRRRCKQLSISRSEAAASSCAISSADCCREEKTVNRDKDIMQTSQYFHPLQLRMQRLVKLRNWIQQPFKATDVPKPPVSDTCHALHLTRLDNSQITWAARVLSNSFFGFVAFRRSYPSHKRGTENSREYLIPSYSQSRSSEPVCHSSAPVATLATHRHLRRLLGKRLTWFMLKFSTHVTILLK